MKTRPDRSSISQEKRKNPVLRLGVNEKFSIDPTKTSYPQSIKNKEDTFKNILGSYRKHNVFLVFNVDFIVA